MSATTTARARAILVRELCLVGFRATALDYQRGSIDVDEVARRLRRDSNAVAEPHRGNRLAIAEAIEWGAFG